MAILFFDTYRFLFQKKSPVRVESRSFHSLSLRIKGKISITDNDGKTFYSQSPCITFVPKGMAYTTEILENGEIIAIHFDATETFFENRLTIFELENSSVFDKLFFFLIEKQNKGNPEQYSAFSTLYEILSLLSEIMEHQRIPPSMRRAKKLLDENLQNPYFSVSELSQMLEISEVYLRREFKKYFDFSPLAYLNQNRMNQAKAMLKTDYYSILQIAELCGFSSPSYFSYAFRKATGLSPSEYASRFL